MQKSLFIYISIFIISCSGSKITSTGTVIDITVDKVNINNVDIGKVWKLNTILDAINSKPREIKLNKSSYFIFDDLGLVVYEKSPAFEPTERGFVDAFNIFFKKSPDNKDWPKTVFNGKLTLDGENIDAKFKLSDLNKLKSGWDRSTSMGSEKLENGFLKLYFTFDGEELSYINIALKD